MRADTLGQKQAARYSFFIAIMIAINSSARRNYTPRLDKSMDGFTYGSL